jgi:putative aldouronate transport system substrate-binding protein
MKKKQNFIVFLIITWISVLLLTGCGNNKKPAGSDGKGEPVTITIYQGNGIPQPTGDDAIVPNAIKEQLGIDVVMVGSASGNDYLQQLNTRLAAGDPPDIFQVSTRDMLADLVNQNIPLELTPYLEKIPDYVALAKTSIKKGYIGTGLYAFANYMNVHPSSSFFIRTDWLENLGLKMPTNLDEFRSVLLAFTNSDPDGNGQKDTFGFGGYGVLSVGGTTGSGFSDLCGAWGIPAPGDTFIKDGKVVNALDDPAMPQFLAYVADLYGRGTIDPQSFAYTYHQAQQSSFQGKFGVVQMQFFEMRKQNFIDDYKAVNPKAEWLELPAVQGPNGAYNCPRDVVGGGTLRVIPASLAKNDPQKLDKIFELINWISGGEGLKLVEYGLNERHHKRNAVGDVIEITDALLAEGSYLWSWQLGGRPEEDYYKIRWPTMLYDLDFNFKAPRLVIYNSVITPPQGYMAAEANTYIEESLVAFITGNTPLSQYSNFLNTLKTQFKYQQYIDAAAQQLKDMGYVN